MHADDSRFKRICIGTEDVTDAYLADRGEEGGAPVDLQSLPRAPDLGKKLRFTQCAVVDASGQDSNRLLFGEPFKIRLAVEANVPLADVSVVVGLDTQSEVRVATLASEDGSALYACKRGQSLQITIAPAHLILKPGRYFLTLGARSHGQPLDHLPHVLRFDIENVPWRGGRPVAETWGILHVQADWSSPSAERAVSTVSEETGD